MKHLLNVYPYEVDVALPDTVTSYGAQEYADRVEEAANWLGMMGLDMPEHWVFARISGDAPSRFEFKRSKDALLFKIAFG
ncbi:hypothetical protein D3C87_737110 [compost metagenome]